jgi:hypothetical protein
MITAAIQGKLQAIIPNTFPIVGDEEIECPWCYHKETGTPIRLKEGLKGYTYDCEVAIIAALPDEVETYAAQIITGVESLAGTITSGTTINTVTFEGDEPDFDYEQKFYTNILRFIIETANR